MNPSPDSMTDILPLTFFVAGFSKCGTTTFSHLLASHPRIAMPSIKEPSFFSSADFEQRWDWFRSLYPDNLTDFDAVGDDSNQYSSFDSVDDVAPLLAERYPDARLVFLARDPVARIESAFKHFHDDGVKYGISCPFELELAMRDIPGVLENAKFWQCTNPFRAHFRDEQILVIHLEDLTDDPGATLARVFDHLGVDHTTETLPATTPRLNSTEERFYDTRLLRRLRRHPFVGPRLARLVYEEQERVLRPLRLRRRFTSHFRPRWSAEAIDIVVREVLPDAGAFARTYGLPRLGWPRFADLVGRDQFSDHVTVSS